MISPHELRNKNFSKTVRGYSQLEVDDHIEFIIEKYTEIYRENDELKKKLNIAFSKIEKYSNDEESIKSALINAQKSANDIIKNANEQAKKIINNSKNECNEIISKYDELISKKKQEIMQFNESLSNFKKDIIEMINNEINSINSLPEINTDNLTEDYQIEIDSNSDIIDESNFNEETSSFDDKNDDKNSIIEDNVNISEIESLPTNETKSKSENYDDIKQNVENDCQESEKETSILDQIYKINNEIKTNDNLQMTEYDNTLSQDDLYKLLSETINFGNND